MRLMENNLLCIETFPVGMSHLADCAFPPDDIVFFCLSNALIPCMSRSHEVVSTSLLVKICLNNNFNYLDTGLSSCHSYALGLKVPLPGHDIGRQDAWTVEAIFCKVKRT